MFRVLLLGVEPICRAAIENALSFAELIEGPSVLQEISSTPINPLPKLILCGRPRDGRTLEEHAQGVSMAYPEIPAYFLTSEKVGFDRAALQKNGFTDAFLLPFEAIEFESKVQEVAAQNESGDAKLFKPIRLLDLKPGLTLRFDTYLFMPANNKYIKFSNANKAILPEQFERLKKFFVNSLYIRQLDSDEFFKFTAQQLVAMGNVNGMSETERQQRMQSAVRALLSELFTDPTGPGQEERGQRLMQDCTEIVKSYFEATDPRISQLFEKIEKISDSGAGSYGHSANTAALASLFSIGLQVGDPEHFAIAGLLHDIGMAELPAEIQSKQEKDLSPEELKIYGTHPQLAIDVITKHKMAIPEEVRTIVLNHHENFNGTGFPAGLRGLALSTEAQLLAVADVFVELTEVKAGQKRVSPLQAINAIMGQDADLEINRSFDPAILSSLRKLLFEDRAFIEANKSKAS